MDEQGMASTAGAVAAWGLLGEHVEIAAQRFTRRWHRRYRLQQSNSCGHLGIHRLAQHGIPHLLLELGLRHGDGAVHQRSGKGVHGSTKNKSLVPIGRSGQDFRGTTSAEVLPPLPRPAESRW